MDFFSIDFATLSRQLLPVRLRNGRFKAWVRSLTMPVEWLYDKFVANRTANNYYVAHNGQICHMEAVLNNRFDSGLRRIEIHNGPFYDPIYIFLNFEDWPTHLATDDEIALGPLSYAAPVYLFTHAEIYDTGVLFIVYLPPLDLPYTDDEHNEIRGLIERYRLPSKKNYLVVVAIPPPLEV